MKPFISLYCHSLHDVDSSYVLHHELEPNEWWIQSFASQSSSSTLPCHWVQFLMLLFSGKSVSININKFNLETDSCTQSTKRQSRVQHRDHSPRMSGHCCHWESWHTCRRCMYQWVHHSKLQLLLPKYWKSQCFHSHRSNQCHSKFKIWFRNKYL